MNYFFSFIRKVFSKMTRSICRLSDLFFGYIFLKIIESDLVFLKYALFDYLYSKYKNKNINFLIRGRYNINYLLDFNENSIHREIFAKNGYDDIYFEFFSKKTQALNIKLCDYLFVDIGANIGSFTLLALKSNLFKYSICVEPAPATFKILSKNIVINELENRVILINKAISDKLSYIDFELADYHGDNRTVSQDYTERDNNLFSEHARKKIKIEAASICNILTENNYSEDQKCCYWIDVQGAEVNVLRSIPKKSLNCSIFVIEVWPYGLNRLHASVDDLIDIFEDFYFINLSYDHPSFPDSILSRKSLFEIDELYKISNFLTGTGCADILFIPKNIIDKI